MTEISRRDLAVWSGAVFAARYAAGGLHDLVAGTDVSYGHLANFGIFQLLAWAAVFILLRRGGAVPARIPDILITSLSVCAVLMPDDNATWAGMTLLACHLIFTSRGEPCLRAAATVMAALAIQLFWGRLLFEAVAFQIESLDARMAADLLSFLHHPVVLQGNLLTSGGQQIAIYEACTSFHNISVAMLCWVTVTRLMRVTWRMADLWTAGALVVIVVAMNSMRLFLMASAPGASFTFWHTGPGSAAINAMLSLLVTAISLAAARPLWSRA